MKVNYDIFFKEYRINFGSIKDVQTVTNLKLIIEASEIYSASTNQLAYILATAYHETAHDFIPKYEYGNLEYFVRRYWLNTKVAKALGNTSAKEAFDTRGVGLVQITGRRNHQRFGILGNPSKGLEIGKAIEIIFVGMLEGFFTGAKLGKYVSTNSYNFKEARRVVNGTDKALLIAGYAEKFLIMLHKSEI